MGKAIDLTGQRFGQLTVVGRAPNSNTGKSRWHCQCECGSTTISFGSDLHRGRIHHCKSTVHNNVVDLVGERFGRLVVIERLRVTTSNRSIRWLCKCDCGRTTIATGYTIKAGNKLSCGCLISDSTRQRSTIHGYAGTQTHTTWVSMIKRCENPKDPGYTQYGGRGVKVCDRWHDFVNFLADMGERPNNLTIDRIDNDGNYEPGNCRWATAKEQGNNTSRNRHIRINGELVTVKQASEITGVKYETILTRLNKGLSDEDAIKPVKNK